MPKFPIPYNGFVYVGSCRQINVGAILRSLPSFVLKRIFNASRLKKEIDIAYGTASPVRITVNPSSPYIEIYLRLTNKSAIPVVVDRILFEVGVVPIEFAHLRRFSLKPNETIDAVYTRQWLHELQLKNLKFKVDEQTRRLKETVNVRVVLFGDSKVGPFSVDKHFTISGDSMPAAW